MNAPKWREGVYAVSDEWRCVAYWHPAGILSSPAQLGTYMSTRFAKSLHFRLRSSINQFAGFPLVRPY